MKLTHGQSTKWMVILNLSPDSFSGDGFRQQSLLKHRLDSLKKHRPDFLDFGAVSTRPGSDNVSPTEEWLRIKPAIPHLRRFSDEMTQAGYPVSLSIDTSSPQVLRQVLDFLPVQMVNDVWSGQKTDRGQSTFDLAAKHNLSLIVMHMKGTPKTMQLNPQYTRCSEEVLAFLADRIALAKQMGVEEVYADPGIGFGKTLEHNLELLNQRFFHKAHQQDLPVCIGLSRKRFLGELERQSDPHREISLPQNRDIDSKRWEMKCVQHGASLIRSHRLPSEIPYAN